MLSLHGAKGIIIANIVCRCSHMTLLPFHLPYVLVQKGLGQLELERIYKGKGTAILCNTSLCLHALTEDMGTHTHSHSHTHTHTHTHTPPSHTTSHIQKSMEMHVSQYLWFRRLYVLFSRYMIVNSFKRL